MSSCSFGTSASFARLPISDVVLRSRTSSVWGEGRVTVKVGWGACGWGGVSRTLRHNLNVQCLTRDEVGLLWQRTPTRRWSGISGGARTMGRGSLAGPRSRMIPRACRCSACLLRFAVVGDSNVSPVYSEGGPSSDSRAQTTARSALLDARGTAVAQNCQGPLSVL